MTGGGDPGRTGGRARRVALRAALVSGGMLAAVAAIEIGLRLLEVRPLVLGAEPQRRPHHLYTETGLGKCYPSDPRAYFPYDLRTPDGAERLGDIIGDVTHLPGEWSREEKVAHLRRYAPFCTNIELVRINGGPDPERERAVLLIGDSFTFGEGLRVRDTIGYRLAERFPDINFPNMAWPGAGVDTMFDVADTPGDVDHVLYFYNLNDILRTPALAEQRRRQHEAHEQARAAPPREAGAAAAFLCRHLALCRLVAARQSDLALSQSTVDYYRTLYFGAENAAPRAETFARIGAMHETLAAQDGTLTVVVFPLFYKPVLGDYPFRDIHALIAAELAARGVDGVDLLPAYDGYLSWERFLAHPLDRHPSAAAIEVAADYLRERLDLDTAAATDPGGGDEET